jgi:hypothetical protein
MPRSLKIWTAAGLRESLIRTFGIGTILKAGNG